MGDGDQVHAQKLGERQRIDLIGFNLGIGDGFDVFGMGEDEIDTVLTEKIAEPIPVAGGFDHGSVVAVNNPKVIEDPLGIISHFGLFDHAAVFIDGADP